jgi:formylmethanofuran dehydrogenase subunit D
MGPTFVLIPGRTNRQGRGVSRGKFDPAYLQEITTVLIAPEDMQRLGLSPGDRVRLTSDTGQVEVVAAPAQRDELPPGVLFIPYGDSSSRLMGADTEGSGMPTSKGLLVQLEIARNDATAESE